MTSIELPDKGGLLLYDGLAMRVDENIAVFRFRSREERRRIWRHRHWTRTTALLHPTAHQVLNSHPNAVELSANSFLQEIKHNWSA